MNRLLLVVASLLLASCATTFTGSSTVKDGPKGCKAKCEQWGMELAGMVAMGEYSDGCICQVPAGQKTSSLSVPDMGAILIGVELAKRAREAASGPPVGQLDRPAPDAVVLLHP
ncbi:MAG TPA: hypothetical protein VKB87_09090 [Myxococcaceae bacterium]|nr:hypothetical protein [Myxococcaceae bacterium]